MIEYSWKSNESFYLTNRLKHLESLEISTFDWEFLDENKSNLDNMFEGLTNCNTLIDLVILNFKFRNFGIDSFPNLESLEIDTNSLLKDNVCIKIFETSLKLKSLKLYECPRVTENIIEKASKIKGDRGDHGR